MNSKQFSYNFIVHFNFQSSLARVYQLTNQAI